MLIHQSILRLFLAKTSLLVFVIFTLGFLPVSEIPAADVDENSLYEECKTVYTEGRTAEYGRFERFLAAFPDSHHRPEIMFMQAASEQFIDDAMRRYRTLISENPGSRWSAKAHVEMIRRYYLLSEYKDAAKYYESLPLQYKDYDASYWLARCLLAKGDSRNGMFILRNLYGIGGYRMALGVADSYFGKQEYGDAAKLYNWIIETSRESVFSASAQAQLCKISELRGKESEIRSYYQIIIEKYPLSPEAQLVRFRLRNPQEPLPYFIQTGAFSQKERATDLVNQLKSKEYRAYLLLPENSSDNLYRVRVGPFNSRKDAEEVALKLRENEGLPAMLVEK